MNLNKETIKKIERFGYDLEFEERKLLIIGGVSHLLKLRK